MCLYEISSREKQFCFNGNSSGCFQKKLSLYQLFWWFIVYLLKDLSSSHSSLNQSGHSVHSHQSLNQSFNSNYASPPSNHHPQGHTPSPHNLARNHAASPSTSSSSNLYHAHFASSTNQNHSSGAVTTHQNATGPQQGKNTSPSFANSVMQPSGHGPHPGRVKGTDRSSGGGSYRQYVGAAHTGGDLHGVKASHMTSEQHHRLFSQNKQGTGTSYRQYCFEICGHPVKQIAT